MYYEFVKRYIHSEQYQKKRIKKGINHKLCKNIKIK